jgi:hypothetical protein
MPTSAPAAPYRSRKNADAHSRAVTVMLKTSARPGSKARPCSFESGAAASGSSLRTNDSEAITATSAIAISVGSNLCSMPCSTTPSTKPSCTTVATDDNKLPATAAADIFDAARAREPSTPIVAALETKPPKNPAMGSPRPGPNARKAT